LAIDILNISLYDRPLSQAVDEIIAVCLDRSPKVNRLVSATGAHGLVIAQRNQDFARLLSHFYLNLPDGMPTVWIGRLKGSKSMERCYGPDLFQEVMVRTANTAVRHYLCGGKERVALRLREECARKFGNRNCVGIFSPPFDGMTAETMRRLGEDINNCNSDIVWIGLSTPKQEYLANELAKYTKAQFIVTVGAAFDFHVGAVSQAPKLLQRMGLEWAFRLMMEPRRLFRRYLEVVPLFLYYGMRDLVRTLKTTNRTENI